MNSGILARWLFAVCSLAAIADTSVVGAQKSTKSTLQQVQSSAGRVLPHLRDDELAKALEALGEAADQSTTIHASQDDGLSAAAGGLHRALTQLSEDEQFDLLYEWSMPTGTRKTVRLLTTIVPQVAPPKAFARAIGERPRDDSFPVSSVGGVRGLYSTGWSLVRAADEAGRLRRLTTELETLAADNVPNADVLLLLARLADTRSDVSKLAKSLEDRAEVLRNAIPKPGQPPKTVDPSNIVIAAAALKRDALRTVSEGMLDSLIESTYGAAAPRLRPFLRLAHATAVQLNRGQSGPEVLRQNRLKYWVPVSGRTSAFHSRGAVDATWLVHEDHILHLAGTKNDVLFFRYPLTGEFEFRCEAQEGGRITTDGGLVYGGLQFQALGRWNQLTVWDADIDHFLQKPCPFVRSGNRPTFNRMSIRCSADQAILTANLHPMWFDKSSDAHGSPWLGLRSFDDRRPMFRNLGITGKPVIPREVRMSDGDQLRGWRSHFFGERQPAFTTISPVIVGSTPKGASLPAPNWSVNAGMIQGTQRQVTKGANPQSLLRYQRPLLDGESISYEFQYEPGKLEVHPALGRLAFLIESGGVRIHWITDGSREWSGLSADNSVLEPLNRRGPRPLPLREGDWNEVTLARAAGKVTLMLNGKLIYQRSVDFGGDHSFGFFFDRTKSAAKIRNVVMTGDWPKTLPEDFIKNPAVVAAE